MLPIGRFPRIVEQQATWFDTAPTADEQRKHFREYVTGLIVGHKAAVTAINQLFSGHNDQSSLNKFAIQLTGMKMRSSANECGWSLSGFFAVQLAQKPGV